MKESPEDRAMREVIESHVNPLRKEIQSLREQLPGNKVETTSQLFEDILRETPLYTRLKVYLEMEYLNAILQGSDCCDDEEFLRAHKWAKSTTAYIVHTFKEWERDGKPGKIPDKV